MSTSVAKPRPLIAVIEDDVAVLNSLEFSLGAEGYDVRAYERGRQALASTDLARADCLVIDYGLPDLDGLSVLDRLRRMGVACPAIIIASTPTPHCWREARAAGVPVVEKPLLNGALEAMIRDCLKS